MAKSKYVLAVDQSTSATKAILFTKNCMVHHRVTINHSQIHPHPDWIEHDPEEIIKNVKKSIIDVVHEAGVTWDEIASIAITNQRETGLIWDAESGKPIYNAIVWQCPRAKDICDALYEMPGKANSIFKKTGLHLSPYFTAPKIQWIMKNVDETGEMAESGKLKFGTIDSWLIYNLTGRKIHATDYSNASRTLLFNVNELKWDKELLDIFQIPINMMPEIKPSDSIFGVTAGNKDIPDGIPISGVMGDSHAALFGQNCYCPGMMKITYGTGSSVMMNIGSEPVYSNSGIVTSVGWITSTDVIYVLEGNINSAGKTIEWLVTNLELLSDPKESFEIACKVPDNGGVYFVPAFTGLGAPYWDNKAKAIISGLTFSTKRENIIRAAEESIAYQITDIVDLMQKDTNVALGEIRVDGGPTRDPFLMQFQSDMLNIKVVVPAVEELSALGSANMAGLATGFWNNREEIKQMRTVYAEYIPKIDNENRIRNKNGWHDAIKRALSIKKT